MSDIITDTRYMKKCKDCEYRDDNPCKPCYENEHILGWHFYWEEHENE